MVLTSKLQQCACGAVQSKFHHALQNVDRYDWINSYNLWGDRKLHYLQTLTIQYGLSLLVTGTGRSLVTGGRKGRGLQSSVPGWKRRWSYNTAIYRRSPFRSLSSLPSFPPFTTSLHVRKDIILDLEQVVHHGLEGQLVQDGRDGIKPTARRETSQIHVPSPLFLWQQVLWSLFHISCVPRPLYSAR